MGAIVVVDYDPAWPEVFEQLRSRIGAVVGDVALSIEHVGSTAVPGLVAKPIIDLDVVVAGDRDVATAIERLATLGYVHEGNLGIEGREAFSNPAGSPAHHLYVCRDGNLALRNHLAIRDFLRSNARASRTYGELKKRLAETHGNDIDGYIDGKTDFLLELLRQSNLTPRELEQISDANRVK